MRWVGSEQNCKIQSIRWKLLKARYEVFYPINFIKNKDIVIFLKYGSNLCCPCVWGVDVLISPIIALFLTTVMLLCNIGHWDTNITQQFYTTVLRNIFYFCVFRLPLLVSSAVLKRGKRRKWRINSMKWRMN